MVSSEAAGQPFVAEPSADVFKGFEGQRTPTPDDYKGALFSGLIVVDANVLLDFYRYNESARTSLLTTFRQFGARLWIPHQALKEFWSNREDVLGDPQGTKEVLGSLDRAEATAVQSVNSWAKLSQQSDHVRSEVSSNIKKGFEAARRHISSISDDMYKEWSKDTNSDSVLRELTSLLQGRVGSPLSEAEYESAVKEAHRRIDAKVPPGYKDNHKSDPKAVGDYIIWLQMIKEAAARGLDVLFVTRDLKEDWLRRKNDELSGPRPELVEEMLEQTGHRFFLRSPVGVLELARNIMSVDVSDESLADARRLNDLPDEVRDEAISQSGVMGAGFDFLKALYGGDWIGTWDATHPTLRLCLSQFWADRNREALQLGGHDYKTVADELSATSHGDHELWKPFTDFLHNRFRDGVPLDPEAAGIGHSRREVDRDTELLYVHPKGGFIWQPGETRLTYPLLMQLDKGHWKVLNWRSETIPVPGYPPTLQ